MKNTIAIVTAISGLKIPLVDPSVKFQKADYYAFVDKYQDVNVWRQNKVQNFSTHPIYTDRMNAKIYKILPELYFPDYEWIIWIDSTHEVIESPEKIIDEYMTGGDIGVFIHNTRNCVYDESRVVIDWGKNIPDEVNKQVEFYRECNYPQNNGLFELSVIIRRNKKNIRKLNLMWWEQICKFSSRDQISFPFVLWKSGVVPNILPGFANTDFHNIPTNKLIPHTRDMRNYV